MQYRITDLQKVAYSLIIVLAVGFLLFVGQRLLLPLFYAILFSIAVTPIDKKVRSWGTPRWVSITITLFVVVLPILSVLFVLGWQISNIVDGLPSIVDSLKRGSEQVVAWIGNHIPMPSGDIGQIVSDNISKVLEKPLSLVGAGLQSTGTLVVAAGLCVVYTFFLLFYRESLKDLLVQTFDKEDRPEVKEAIRGMKETIQAYIGGMGLVMLLLAVVNSIGLFAIGIEYALFWGALAGTLAIIPYIGTLISGLLPFLYAIATTDTLWQPVAVIVFFGIVQQLEGNVITPKIVGSKVDINPFIAVLALVFFGTFWGLAGIILSIPIVAAVRIVLTHITGMGAYVELMGSSLGEEE